MNTEKHLSKHQYAPRSCLLIALFIIAHGFIHAQQVTITYDNPISFPGQNSSGTSASGPEYTFTAGIPSGATNVTGKVYGGGGGSGGINVSGGHGGGGGGGGYIEKNFGNLSGSISGQVGAGGKRGENNANGAAGTSSFITFNATTITANGGGYGGPNTYGQGGGTSANGDYFKSGDNGGADGSGEGGAGGNSGGYSNGYGGGAGGPAFSGMNSQGYNGYNPGGGGGGARAGLFNQQPGGHGGGGRVVLTFGLDLPVIAGDNFLCVGNTLTLSISNPIAAIYTWRLNGNIVQTGGLPTYTVSNVSAADIGTYTVEATISGYTYDRGTVTTSGDVIFDDGAYTLFSTGYNVWLNEIPVLNNIGNYAPSCAGNLQPAITFGGSNVDATKCTWTNSNPAIGLAASGTGNIPSFTLNNTTGSSIISTITVTPVSFDGCTGEPKSFTIEVTPVVTPTITIQATPN